jgi:hypothetical protein
MNEVYQLGTYQDAFSFLVERTDSLGGRGFLVLAHGQSSTRPKSTAGQTWANWPVCMTVLTPGGTKKRGDTTAGRPQP